MRPFTRTFCYLTCLFLFSLVVSASAFAWTKLPGAATDIAISPEGTVFILGTNRVDGGYAVYRWTGRGWAHMTGGGVAIAAGPHNSVWVIDNAGHIFRYISGGWQKMSGEASDIAAGADGSVYITGKEYCGTGYSIYRFVAPNGWAKLTGCGTEIAVSPHGKPWVSNSGGEIFRYDDSGRWTQVKGLATKIAPLSDSNIWVTGASYCSGGKKIYHYIEGNWTQMPGCADDIAVAPDGTIWVVNDSGEIFNSSAKYRRHR
jgi:DNA-binding beta-propeller fold protein YncE